MAEWIGFTNITLNESDKKAVKELASGWDDSKTVDYFARVIDEGYKFTVAYDAENSAYVVSLTGKDGCINAGRTMSQRHSVLTVAICASYYAHVTLADLGPWESVVENWLSPEW